MAVNTTRYLNCVIKPLLLVVSLFSGVATLYGQSGADKEFTKLTERAKLLRDSLPAEAKRVYLQALPVGKNQKPETIARLYNELGTIFQEESNYDSSFLFYRRGLRLAINADDPQEEISSYQGIADNLRNLSLKDSSHFYLDRALTVAKEHNLYGDEAGIYSDLGNVYRDESDLEKSLAHYIKSATLYDSLVDDPMGLSRAFSNIANIHYLLGNYDKAIGYIDQSNPIAKERSFYRVIAYNHKLAGRIYRQKKDLNKALEEYQEAMASYQKSGDKFSMSETALGIGNLRYDQEEYSKAIIDYKQGLEFAREIGVRSLMAYNYSALGFAYFSLEQWKPATAYMDSTRVTATEVNYPSLVMDAYEILSSIQREQHNYEKALEYLYKYNHIKDSLTSAENRSAIEEAEAKYQNGKKTAEIELLHKDQLIQAATIQKNKIITGGVVAALIAAVVIGLLVFNRYRLVTRAKRQIEMERMRNQIARDLHDDIGSTLSSINIISQVALKENGHSPQLTPHFQRIHEHSARMMESMSDIVWSIHPGNDSMEKVVVKMKEFCAEILEPKDIAYTFENAEHLEGVTLDLESRKNLFLIFKEIINNAAKYSEATEVRIAFSRNPQGWAMDICDNGIGFQPELARSGNGLNNIRNRAEALGAEIKLTTSPGKGTRTGVEVRNIT